MYFYTKDDIESARQMYDEGVMPSEILRRMILKHEDTPVPELMMLLEEAFSLPHEATQCLGGWWHDGSAELSDERIDEWLLEDIKKYYIRERDS